MQCPKCKKIIEDNSIKCRHCSARIGSLCKKCGAYNLITAEKCSACGVELLRICSECGAANLPNAAKCRKCGIEFLSKQDKDELFQPIYFANMNTQQKIKSLLIDGLKNSKTRVITINGEEGAGKNLVLRYTINELKNANLIWLLGSCTQITQLSPFGYFQDLLLSFFNINNFCPDTLQLKKNSIKFFKQDFPALSNNEIADLLNLLYPERTDKYENIYFNKAKMFSIMHKVINTIADKMKLVFIIDHFDFLDSTSFDFLKELLEDDYILPKSKFIIINSQIKPGMGLITSSKLTEENYLDLSIAPFSPTLAETFLKQQPEHNFGTDFINFAIKLSGGNPATLEQFVLLQDDIKRNKLKNLEIRSLEDIMNIRLKILKSEYPKAYRTLLAMSVLGNKFYPAILENLDGNSPEEFEHTLDTLINTGFIARLNNLTFEFKGANVWKAIVNSVKNDSCFEEILNMLYEIFSTYKQSSIALTAYIAQKLNNYDQAFDIWTKLTKLASYNGDIGLYIIAQKQCLKLIENKTGVFYQKVKKNIHTRVGKLLEPINHELALDYLQKAILMLDDNEDNLHIELLGYISSCAMKAGNYCGVIECVENILNLLPEEMSFEKTMVKTRLVRPLLNLGNYGQLINLLETELLGELEFYLSKNKFNNSVNAEDVFNSWLSIYYDYAEALVFQGNNRAFEIISSIFEILDKNNISNPELICKANLLLALANTIKGDVKTSSKILEDMLKDFSSDNINELIISRWNLTDIINKMVTKDYNAVQDELFNVTVYANNINDNFTKNILKTLLAKLMKDKGQTKDANTVLEEQVSYFAKEKSATGVLLSWYLIAKIKLITNGAQYALDVATKALDIAQGPNINNYYFITLFNKLLGEIYITKQDFESAKVYIEKSIFLAKQFDLQYLLVKDYLLSAKLYQELALPKSSSRTEYIKRALKMFQLAKNVPLVTEQTYLQKCIKEELNILTSFCKLNGIALKKG